MQTVVLRPNKRPLYLDTGNCEANRTLSHPSVPSRVVQFGLFICAVVARLSYYWILVSFAPHSTQRFERLSGPRAPLLQALGSHLICTGLSSASNMASGPGDPRPVRPDQEVPLDFPLQEQCRDAHERNPFNEPAKIAVQGLVGRFGDAPIVGVFSIALVKHATSPAQLWYATVFVHCFTNTQPCESAAVTAESGQAISCQKYAKLRSGRRINSAKS